MKRIVTAILLFVCIGVAIAAPIIRAISTVTTTTPSLVDGTSMLYPVSVTMLADSGVLGTMEYSTSPNAYISPASARWEVLSSASAVSGVVPATIVSPVTAIRFTRVSGASSVVGEVAWRVAP